MQKKLYLALIIFLAMTLTSITSYAANNGDTSICRWYDNKKAAYSITYDDGLSDSLVKFESTQSKYGLVGTAGLISGWIDKGENKDGYSIADWSFYKDMASRGVIDMCSHTNTHPDLVTQAVYQIDDEFSSSKASIINNIGSLCGGLIYPYYSCDSKVKAEAEKYFICAAQGGDNDGNAYNTTDYYGLYRYTPYKSTTVTKLNNTLSSGISKGNWFILCTHGCDNEGWEAKPLSFFDSHYKYVNSKRGYIWNDYYTHVAMYLRERNTSTVSVGSVTSSQINVNITNALDIDTYNHPLTMKTKVPTSWTSVWVSQGTKRQNVKVTNEGLQAFVYYDAIPNQGEIVIAKSSSGETNVALNKSATASSAYSTSYAASKANDGNTSTRWCAADGTFPTTWTVDLGAQHDLTGTELNVYPSDTWKYTIAVSSDNTNFTKVVDKTSNTTRSEQFTDSFAASGRYVKITFTGSEEYNWASISEIKVYGVKSTSTITNVALNKSSTASSAFSTYYAASKANDGDTSTRWCAADGTFPATWTVDLGSQRSLTGIEMNVYPADTWKYSVAVSSDNINFVTVVDKASNTTRAEQFTDSFNSNARYVKITFTGCAEYNWASISEIKVLGI